MGDSSKSRPIGDLQNVPQYDREDQDSTKNIQFAAHPSNLPQGSYPYMNQYPQQHGSPARPESFNMNSLGGALPSYPDYNTPGSQRYPQGSTALAPGYQMQSAQQYPSSPYSSNYNNQYQGQYGPAQSPSSQIMPHTPGQIYNNPGFISQTQSQGQQFFMQQNQYMTQNTGFAMISGGAQFSGRGSFPGDPRLQIQHRGRDFAGPASSSGTAGRNANIVAGSSVVRGPPRKPRQSGHAIWIGNLPPQTDLMSLVHHVCKETKGLQSLFLISKSNCAFANYKDEASCAEAQAKIHDSRFQSVRLVSRLRRNSTGDSSGVPVPTVPTDSNAHSTPTAPRSPSPKAEAEPNVEETVSEAQTPQETESVTPPQDQFFVVKSLTVEDLELSVRNGIWATQSHNEDVLNKAYETTDNVYLIFSANKSGEYFGYARMASPINDDPAAAIEFAPKAQAVEDPELPKAIPTAATEFAPKGRIIDDSARGTIFWEVEMDENEEADAAEEEEEEEGGMNRGEPDSSQPPTKAWGKPFKVDWISTTRLPFYRTRGMRNPWNSNREVKIARDGTALETAIGRKLLALFDRLPSPVVAQMTGVSLVGGYPPQMRGYQ